MQDTDNLRKSEAVGRGGAPSFAALPGRSFIAVKRRRRRGRAAMTARGALAGLVLAALGASGAPADDDAYFALLEVCYGNSVRSLEAIRIEFPDFLSNTVAMLLAVARSRHASSAVVLDPAGPVAEVEGACVSADGFETALEMLRSGDPRKIELLRRAWTEGAP